jgi:hypothetical protein
VRRADGRQPQLPAGRGSTQVNRIC